MRSLVFIIIYSILRNTVAIRAPTLLLSVHARGGVTLPSPHIRPTYRSSRSHQQHSVAPRGEHGHPACPAITDTSRQAAAARPGADGTTQLCRPNIATSTRQGSRTTAEYKELPTEHHGRRRHGISGCHACHAHPCKPPADHEAQLAPLTQHGMTRA